MICKHFHYSIGGCETLCWEWSPLPGTHDAWAWCFYYWPQARTVRA